MMGAATTLIICLTMPWEYRNPFANERVFYAPGFEHPVFFPLLGLIPPCLLPIPASPLYDDANSEFRLFCAILAAIRQLPRLNE
jgi:hypothetical protein